MITEKTFKKALIAFMIIILFVLTALILKPIAMAIITGLILAYVFNPLFKRVNSIFKERNLSAFFICIVALLLILLPIWFLTPILVKQTFELYSAIQDVDLFSALKKIFPTAFTSEQFSREVVLAINNFIGNSVSLFLEILTKIITNFPALLLQIFIVLFTFFYALRDSDKFINYLQSLLPFTAESEKQFFNQTKAVTNSIIYGQAITGIIQGILTGLGLYIFGVSNPLVLTIIAIFASILPIIGPWLVWFPAAISLFFLGNTVNGIGLFIYGLIFPSLIDNFIRPYIVAKQAKIPTSIALIGMIGGLFVFGVLGLIIGPLILAYLLIILEFYRNKKFSSLFQD